MAYQKPYVYKGITLPEAYFRVGKYQFNRVSNMGSFVINVYADKAARDAGVSNYLEELPAYTITEPMTEEECYLHVLTVLNTESGQFNVTHEFDEEGNVTAEHQEPIMVSFFADAEVV